MAASKKPMGWGGYREGAGRKAQFTDSADRTIRFERKDLEALDSIAAQQETSAADLIREFVARYVRRRRK